MDPFRSGFGVQAVSDGLSHRSADRLVSIFGSRADSILGLVRARPELGAEIDPESGAIAAEVVFAGRLIAEKGVDLLIDAVARLAGQGAGIRCRIVGDGP